MTTIKYGPATPQFWAAFWIHMRPYLLFISGIAGATGIAISVNFEVSGWMRYGTGFLAFFLAYGFGQALTDCFQVDTDSLSAPYRPLSQGIVDKSHVGIIALIGLIAVATVLVVLNSVNALFCMFSILGLLTYSRVKRRFWWGGPPYNALIVACLPVMGYNVFATGAFVMSPVIWMVTALSFLAYFNFVIIGYLKDISADRETGYRTFPVVHGWLATALVGDVVVIGCSVLVWYLVGTSIFGLVLAAAGSIVAILGQVHLHTTKDRTEANSAFAIAATVRSFILWHLAVIISFIPEAGAFVIVYYLLFEFVLQKRPLKHQI